MDFNDITAYRLSNLRISNNGISNPHEAVFGLGALQAQDYPASLWAIGLRCGNSTISKVREEIANKRIIRTWSMRHTLHFVSFKDVRWMLRLYQEGKIPKYQRNNGLTEEILDKGLALIRKAFSGKKRLTYKEMHNALKGTGIKALERNDVQSHIIRRAGREGIICYGTHDGKQPTFALLENWVPKAKPMKREDSLSEFALRYFTSHGPATMKDYMWWSGMNSKDARLGISRASQKLRKITVNDKIYYMGKSMRKHNGKSSAHLLPAFDEYIVGYRDRSAMLSNSSTRKALRNGIKGGAVAYAYSNGVFVPTIIINGQVAGTWKSISKNGKLVVETSPFARLTKNDFRAVKAAAEEYGAFMGMDAAVR